MPQHFLSEKGQKDWLWNFIDKKSKQRGRIFLKPHCFLKHYIVLYLPMLCNSAASLLRVSTVWFISSSLRWNNVRSSVCRNIWCPLWVTWTQWTSDLAAEWKKEVNFFYQIEKLTSLKVDALNLCEKKLIALIIMWSWLLLEQPYLDQPEGISLSVSQVNGSCLTFSTFYLSTCLSHNRAFSFK